MTNQSILISKLFLIGVLLAPIHIFSLKLFNELIILLAVVYIGGIFFSERLTRLDLTILGVGLFVSVCFMSINMVALENSEFVIKDFVESVKPILFCSLAVCGRIISKNLTLRDVTRFVIIVCVLQVIFSCLIFIPSLHDFVDLFKGRQSVNAFNTHFFRFSGSMGFPSLFGIWIGLSIILTLFAPSPRNKCLYVPILLAGLYFSQSRTGVILLLLSCVAVYFAYIKKRSWDWRPHNSQIISVFLLFLIIFIVYLTQDISDKFSVAFNNISSSSLHYRIIQFDNFTKVFVENPLGIGSSSLYITANFGVIENAYFYYGVKYGVFGLAWFVLICLTTFSLSIRFYNLSRFSCFSICVWLFVSVTLGSYSNAISLEYKSFVFFFLLLGILLGWSRNPESFKISGQNTVPGARSNKPKFR